MRRSQDSDSVIKTGRLTVNLSARSAEVDGQPVHLTGKEFGILELLSLRKGTTLTKEMFLNHLYGGIDEPELKIIDVFVCKIRKKLSKATGAGNYIETVGAVATFSATRSKRQAELQRRLTSNLDRENKETARLRTGRFSHFSGLTAARRADRSVPISSLADRGPAVPKQVRIGR